MKSQVSILVKNENIASRFFSLMWIVNIFKKMSVDMYIDQGAAQRLKARNEPYVIDLTPGQHEIAFTDPRAGGKVAFNSLLGGLFGASMAGAGGGSMIGGAIIGSEASHGTTVKNGVVRFTINEGDILKLSAKPKRDGSVKVKVLKD